ncbi:uncharacterized protein LOC122503665 [Leptopilina heterotoma]|uniref:uncharacterized protein LOC122503665 n=1 Tax=Leptopilina heterotoma TaxID=63436 RepID=UPI001CA8849F|nr:uncharacterized protein LOC122503665 [Leptopilina heterotoma]
MDINCGNHEARRQPSFAGAFGSAMPPGQGQGVGHLHLPKLANFFREDPELWFAQAEFSFKNSRIYNERARASAVVSSLDCEVLQIIGDLITSVDLIPNLYTRIREIIIENFASSLESELRRVLQGESLNDGKPSAFLNKMRHLSRGRCSDEVLKSIFLENLPPGCRSILAVSDTADLTRLATIADRIVENSTVLNQSVASVSENNSNQLSSDILDKMTSLVSRLDALSLGNQNG